MPGIEFEALQDLCPVCHVSGMHATHTTTPKGPIMDKATARRAVSRMSDDQLQQLVDDAEDLGNVPDTDPRLMLADAAEDEQEQREYAADDDEGVREGTGNNR